MIILAHSDSDQDGCGCNTSCENSVFSFLVWLKDQTLQSRWFGCYQVKPCYCSKVDGLTIRTLGYKKTRRRICSCCVNKKNKKGISYCRVTTKSDTSTTNSESKMSNPSEVIDWHEAMQQCGDDEEFLHELLEDLRTELETQVTTIAGIIAVRSLVQNTDPVYAKPTLILCYRILKTHRICK